MTFPDDIARDLVNRLPAMTTHRGTTKAIEMLCSALADARHLGILVASQECDRLRETLNRVRVDNDSLLIEDRESRAIQNAIAAYTMAALAPK